MKITVTVTDAELRGMLFEKYANALWSLIAETYLPQDLQIVHGKALAAVIEGDDEGIVAPEDILDVARDLTHPDFIDAFEG